MIIHGKLQQEISGKYFISISGEENIHKKQWSFCVVGLQRWMKASIDDNGTLKLYIHSREAQEIEGKNGKQVKVIASNSPINQKSYVRWAWA